MLLFILIFKKPALIIGVLIAMGTNFFGAVRLADLPTISLPGVGQFYISDLLLLFFSAILVLARLNGNIRPFRSSIGYPIVALFVLTGFQSIRSIIDGNQLNFIFNQLRDIAYYLIFFLTLGFIKREEDLVKLIKLLLYIGVISAGITYIQAITGQFDTGSFVDYRPEYGIYRSYNLGLYVMTFVFLFLFSMQLNVSNKKIISNKLGSLIMAWVGGALLIMLIRNVWISVFIGVLAVIILNISKINKLAIIFLFFGVFIFFIIPVIVVGSQGAQTMLNIFSQRGSEAYLDSLSGGGTFGLRTLLFTIRWDYMLQTSPILGQGLREAASLSYWDPTHATKENTLAFIATRYGLSGFVIYFWLLISVFKKMILLLKNLQVSWQKTLISGMLAFNIHVVITSYFGSPMTDAAGIVVLASSWAIIEFIERQNRQALREIQFDG